MLNKIQALETMIGMVTEAAADVEDLQLILEVLYNKAEKLDSMIVAIEENSL